MLPCRMADDTPGSPRGHRLRIRILLGKGAPFGPGKADLLEAVRETGSIAAAGRRLGMSYQRAHDLVSAMNSHFHEPVVAPAKGGSRGGGSHLTPFGEEVLAAYRRIEALAEIAAAEPLRWLETRLAPAP
ncbi:winged helix-turn-helix domain-containing protein [Sabulicella glaciei]